MSIITRRNALAGVGSALVGRGALAQAIHGGPSNSAFGQPPPQAAAAGYTTVQFFDDFTSSATITGNGSATITPTINWYPGHGVTLTDPTNYHVLPTTFASQISNSNIGGGPNASPFGGILQITGIASVTNQAVLQTLPQAISQVGHTGQGVFGPNAYFEGYVQLLNTSAQHTAFWMFENNLYTTATGTWITELDIMESNQGFVPNIYDSATVHTWNSTFSNSPNEIKTNTPINNPSLVQSPFGFPLADSNWHTWGVLLTSAGSSQANWSLYMDNVKIGPTIIVGTGTGAPPGGADAVLKGPYMLILGKDNGTDIINFDWVRVWG